MSKQAQRLRPVQAAAADEEVEYSAHAARPITPPPVTMRPNTTFHLLCTPAYPYTTCLVMRKPHCYTLCVQIANNAHGPTASKAATYDASCTTTGVAVP